MISSPWYGSALAPPSKAPDSRLVRSPISGPAISSIIADRAEPLCPPKVSMAPWSSTSAASLLGWP